MEIMDKINNGREYRSMAMSITEAEYTVEGYATTFNQPYLLYSEPGFELWEQVSERAFDNCDMSDVIMQYDHQGRVFARISNKTLECAPDEHGLFTLAYLGGTQIGRNLHEEIKGGYTTKMSYGFTVRGDEVKTEDLGSVIKLTRTITDIGKLYDVSAVSLPANNATEISARAYGEGVIAEAKAERLKAEKLIEERQAKIKLIKILAER